MSLVGFNITNHPQQVGRRGASDTVDERITPQWLFDHYNAQFHFTLDAAANAANKKVETFCSLENSGLQADWGPHSVWCNPPYSDIEVWLAKAHLEFSRECRSIVMLLPANRTEQGWWHRWVEHGRDRPDRKFRTEFIRSRFNFGIPNNEGGKFNSSPPFGCVAVIFDRFPKPFAYPRPERPSLRSDARKSKTP
jgi:phage N-6-adenine-methyltransferase